MVEVLNIFALDLAWNGDIARIQEDLRRNLSPDVEFVDMGSFHVTLVGMEGDFVWDFDIPTGVTPFLLNVGNLEILETPQGKFAIILSVSNTDGLKELQQKLYDYAINKGMSVSEFSNPENWTPHITLGFSDVALELPDVPNMSFAIGEFSLFERVVFEDHFSFRLENVRTYILGAIEVIAPIRSVHFTPKEEKKGFTRYVMLGFPYEGQMEGSLDFHGTRFTPQTDFGFTDRWLPVYFDHARFTGIGRSILGRARFIEDSEEGRLLEIIVEEANKYHDMLGELNELGFLRGSGQAIATCYSVSEEGEIETFHPAEYSFTVQPSNNLAVPLEAQKIKRIMQKYFTKEGNNVNKFAKLIESSSDEDKEVLRSFDEAEQEAFLSANAEERTALLDAKKSPKEEVVEDETKEEDVRRTVAEQVNDAFENANDEQEQLISQETDQLIRSMATIITNLVDQVAELQRGVSEIQEGQVAFATNLSRGLPALIAESRAMSADEADIALRNQAPPASNGRQLASASLASPGGTR